MPQTTPDTAIDKLVSETSSLVSLPTVALEVLRLTESDTIDAAALKDAIEQDPALVVKLLKVVNSSLFGLSGEVSNLTQALALLGARPLKMLVLGFSLPDQLLAEASAEQLDHFWRASLTRALVARDLATEHFDLPPGASPEDAFVAGLLQDLGVMVLLSQLGEPYAGLLDKAADQGVDPTELERESLGFSRLDLSASLLRSWRLPAAIVDAIAGSPGNVTQPLRLADLLVRLVVDRQLDVLPELLERGEAWCGLSGQALRAMVEPLEQQVADLAEAMTAPLNSDADYLQVVADAHARLALVTESALAEANGTDDDQLAEALLAESHDLRLAMRQFLNGRPSVAAKLLRPEGPHTPAPSPNEPPPIEENEQRRLLEALDKLARQTRVSRHALSIALVQVDADLNDRLVDRQLRAALADAGTHLGERRAARLTLGPRLVALLLPAVGRGDAVAYVQELERQLADPPVEAARAEDADLPTPQPIAVRAGVASIEAVPNRFDVKKLADAANGCLSAAKIGSPTSVRSIEVY